MAFECQRQRSTRQKVCDRVNKKNKNDKSPAHLTQFIFIIINTLGDFARHARLLGSRAAPLQ